MKGLISFVVAVAIYFFIGIVAWNIVYSFLDINSMTILAISNYQLCTYSAFTFIIVSVILVTKVGLDHVDDGTFMILGIIIGLNLIIAIALNYWDTAWDIVVSILNIIYNIVNIGISTIIDAVIRIGTVDKSLRLVFIIL